jgi:hypothetical protein
MYDGGGGVPTFPGKLGWTEESCEGNTECGAKVDVVVIVLEGRDNGGEDFLRDFRPFLYRFGTLDSERAAEYAFDSWVVERFCRRTLVDMLASERCEICSDRFRFVFVKFFGNPVCEDFE